MDFWSVHWVAVTVGTTAIPLIVANLIRLGRFQQHIEDTDRRLAELLEDVREIRTWVRIKNGGPVE